MIFIAKPKRDNKKTKIKLLLVAVVLAASALIANLTPFIGKAFAAAAGDVWITAAMPNPGLGGNEYVVVQNKTGATINLSGWKIDDGAAHTISASSSLASGAQAVICDTPLSDPACTAGYSASVVLADAGDSISLKDNSDNVIDQVSYASSTEGVEVTFATHVADADVTVCTSGCDYSDLQTAINDVATGGTITLQSDLTTGSEVSVNKSITLNGNGHTVLPNFTKSGINDSAIEIIGLSSATVSDLTIDGTSGTNLHGLNAYTSTGVALNNLTTKNNDRYGLVVNGSSVTVNNVSTANNGWGGIDVDLGSGVVSPAVLTVNGTSTHVESISDIFVDDTSKDVTVNDTNNQYNYSDVGSARIYKLKPPVEVCNGSTFDDFVLGSVNGQNGWSVTNPNFDQEVVENVFGYPGFGCKSLRFSNSYVSGSFGDQLFAPSVANEAGEADSTSGGQSGGTRQNKYEAEFSFGTTQTTQQPGLALSVSPDRGDGSRMSYLRLEDDVNGIDVFFDDVQGTTNPANFVETKVANDLSRNVAHTAKFEIDFYDGPSNDVVKIYIDGNLVKTGTTWENYYRYDSEAQAEQSPRTIDTLLFRAAGTAAPATDGKGFLFDNVSVSTSINDFTKPTATLTEPVIGSYNPSQMVVVAHDETSLKAVTANIYNQSNTTLIKSCSQNAGGAKDFTLTCSVPSLADGVYTIRANASDMAGHVSNTTTRQFTIDHTAPAVPTGLAWTDSDGHGVADGGFTNLYAGTASWNSSADTDHYIYKYWNDIAGSPYHSEATAWTTNVTGTSLPGVFNQGEGKHFFCVAAVDVAGNTSNCSDAFKVTYDATAPGAPNITQPSAEQYFKTSPILNKWSAVTGDLSGIANYQIKYIYDDGHTFAGEFCDGLFACRSVDGSQTSRNHAPASTEEGGVTIWVRAIDKAGNVGSWSSSVHYYYDHTAPGAAGNPTTTSPTNNKTVTWTWSAATDIAGSSGFASGVEKYKYELVDSSSTLIASGSTSDTNLITTVINDGTYTLSIMPVDKAGNNGPTTSGNVVVDTTPPILTINQLSESTDTTPTITGITTSPTDTVKVTINSTTKQATVAADGTWSASGFTVSPGIYTATVSDKDGLGNESTSSMTFRVNDGVIRPASNNTVVPPNLSLLTNPGSNQNDNDDDGQVLGEQINDNSANPVNNAASVLGDKTSCPSLFGLCWYWYIPIVLAVILIIYYLTKTTRKKESQT